MWMFYDVCLEDFAIKKEEGLQQPKLYNYHKNRFNKKEKNSDVFFGNKKRRKGKLKNNWR